MRGRIALAFVNTGEVTLLDTERGCRRVVESRYNDGQVPAYIRTLAPHLSADPGNLITWVRNAFHTDQTSSSRLDVSSLATVIGQTECRFGRSPELEPGAAGPVDWIAYDILRDAGAQGTSAALEGNKLYLTLSGAGLTRTSLAN